MSWILWPARPRLILCAQKALAERALAASPRSPLARFAKGQVLRAQHRYDDAILEYETAIALNRNWANAYSHLGWCKFMTGSIEELIPAQEQAIRLSPRDPQIGLYYGRIGLVHLLQSRTAEAILWLERARNAAPALPRVRSWLSSAYALNGEIERGAAALAEARRLVGDDRYSSIARLRAAESWGVPKVRALVEATYFAGLRKAGSAGGMNALGENFPIRSAFAAAPIWGQQRASRWWLTGRSEDGTCC